MSEMPPRRSCFLVVFGGVFALIGLAALVFGIYDYTKAIQTYRWPPVPAKVQSISVNYPNKAPSGSENSPFELAVEYDYEVEGKSYSNDRFRRRSVRDGSYQKTRGCALATDQGRSQPRVRQPSRRIRGHLGTRVVGTGFDFHSVPTAVCRDWAWASCRRHGVAQL